MKQFLSVVHWRRLVAIIILPNLAFLALAVMTNAPALIAAGNLVLISMATGVCVAFLPNVVRAFRKDTPLDTESIICLGIFAAWSCWVFRATMSLVWRFFPSMKWIVDSDVNSWVLFVAVYAAFCHLAAPAVIEGRIPSRRWLRIGITAGVGVMAFLVAIYWQELRATWDTGTRLTAPKQVSLGV